MQQPALTPQQEAINDVRTRYEHGQLTFEQFEYALNALIQAQTPEECRGIVQELTNSVNTALDAIPASAPAPAPTRVPGHIHMLNLVGELRRTRRPWKMGRRTTVVMGMGALKLDLTMATMPPQAILEVYSFIGESKIYVPRTMHVTVRQFNLIGENKALGEERNGIFTFFNEEEFPAEGVDDATAPHLIIHQLMFIGSVQIIRSGGQPTFFSRLGALLSGLAGDLKGLDLRGANLEGADLSNKNLEGARMVGANLRGVDFHGSNLSRANLTGANLEDANLEGADLSNARLVGANVDGANMTGANLSGANLAGTNLTRAVVFNKQQSQNELPSAASQPRLPG